MMLHTETVDVLFWLARCLGVFWRIQPRTTALTIGATVFARFTSLAALLLPLKALLLAGSGGGRYFVITDPDTKLVVIFGLLITAVAFYFVTRFLRALSGRLSEAGSLEVMNEANQLALVGDQSLVGRRHFTNITNLCANLIFVALALTVIGLINPLLIVGLAVLFAIQYRFTAFMLAHHGRAPNQLAIRIREKPQDYLQELYQINFWLGFLFILTPFLIGDGGHILLAILSFLLLRQALGALVKAIGSAISLADQKHLIDAFISPSHQWQRHEPVTGRNLRSLFEKEAHLTKLESALAGHFETPRPITVRWKDSLLGGVSTFVLTFRSGPSGPYYQEQVFAPYRAHWVKNEDVLFTHIRRDLLNAPVVLKHFTHGPFQCRLCDYGLGIPPSDAAWNARFAELLEQVWSIEPPDRLVHAFRTSHAFRHDRLTPEFIGRLALAVGSEKEAATLRAFDAVLPTVRVALSEIPLHVSNPDMFRSNTAVRSDGGVSVMIWGRWSLEPIGVYLPRGPHRTKAKLSAMLARVRQRRPDISEMLSPDHLLLAAACRQLEEEVTDANYEAALRALPAILNNPTLASGEIGDAPLRMAGRHDVHVAP